MYVPKHAIRVSPKDILRCSVWSKGSSYDLYVRYVLMLDDGTIVPGLEFINQAGSFTKKTADYKMTDGWLMSVALLNSFSGYAGFSYAVAELVREEDGANYGQIALVQGLTSQVRQLTWPGFNPGGSMDFSERIDSITSSGSAGAQLTITLPAGSLNEIMSIRIAYTSSATAANRRMVIVIDDGADTGIVWRKVSNYVQTASLSRQYFWGRGEGLFYQTGSYVTDKLPLIKFRGGFRIRTVIENLQGNDSALTYYLGLRRQVET